MTIYGKELEFNIFSPDDLERYEVAKRKIAKEYGSLLNDKEKPETDGEYIELLRQGIEAFAEFFDGVFGEGTANILFGEKIDFAKVIDIYLEFVNDVQRQTKALQEKMVSFIPDKATP